jgi:hypothetical protein
MHRGPSAEFSRAKIGKIVVPQFDRLKR